MNELERSLLEDMLDELAAQATPERKEHIRKMRETMLAIKLLERIPDRRPPWWQQGDLWRVALVFMVLIAALLGVKLPGGLNP
jgi:hypothetical protein